MLENPLVWIEAHPGLAGWLQALGAIFSIIYAIIIARSDSRNRQRELDLQHLQSVQRLYDVFEACKNIFFDAKNAMLDPSVNASFRQTAPDLRAHALANTVRELMNSHFPITWDIGFIAQLQADLSRAEEMLRHSITLQHHHEPDKLTLQNIASKLDEFSTRCDSQMKAIEPAIKILRKKKYSWFDQLFMQKESK